LGAPVVRAPVSVSHALKVKAPPFTLTVTELLKVSFNAAVPDPAFMNVPLLATEGVPEPTPYNVRQAADGLMVAPGLLVRRAKPGGGKLSFLLKAPASSLWPINVPLLVMITN